jgi:lipopolysaccharide biosynthesis glycosyltransferase
MAKVELLENTVVTAFDDNYVFPFLVMAHTAKKNSTFSFRFKIAFGKTQLSEKNLSLISRVLSIFEIPFDLIPIELSNDLKPQDHISITAFARLYLADILSKEFLWLDCDLLCRIGWDSIFFEYESALKENTVCAAVDGIPLQNLLGSYDNVRNAAMIRMGENYFNSGVLLVNTEKWKDLNSTENWKEIHSQYQQLGFRYADQCLLNFMCHETFHHLDAKYNVFANVRRNYVRTSKIKILHFPGRDKPWTFQRYSLAILFSSVKARFFLEYFKDQKEMIDSVRIKDPILGDNLEQLQISLVQKRSIGYQLGRFSKKIARLRINIPSLL